jgi:hypothetical protein
MSEFIISIVTSLVVALVGYWAGWKEGKRYGADTQWIDDFLANARREAARRDKLGRFKERNT